MDEPRVVVAGVGVQMRRHLVPALAQLGCTTATTPHSGDALVAEFLDSLQDEVRDRWRSAS
jgi:hypothetical protein